MSNYSQAIKYCISSPDNLQYCPFGSSDSDLVDCSLPKTETTSTAVDSTSETDNEPDNYSNTTIVLIIMIEVVMIVLLICTCLCIFKKKSTKTMKSINISPSNQPSIDKLSASTHVTTEPSFDTLSSEYAKPVSVDLSGNPVHSQTSK